MITVTGNSDGNFYALQTPDYVDAVFLTTAATAYPYVFPTIAKFVWFSANAAFYAKFSTDASTNPASIPAADITDGTGSLLNPVGFQINLPEVSLVAPNSGTIVTLLLAK